MTTKEEMINIATQRDVSLPIAGRIHPRKVGLRLTQAERRALLLLLDLLLINAALVAATTVGGLVTLAVPILLAYFKWFVTLSVLWLLVGTVLDVYNLARAASTTNSVLNTGLAAALTGLIYLTIPWLTPPLRSRLLAFGFVTLATLLIMAWRLVYAKVFVQPRFRRLALVVGHVSPPERDLIHELQGAARASDANPFRGTGYQILGRVGSSTESGPGDAGDSVPLLGTHSRLVHLIRTFGVDEVIVTGDGLTLSSEFYPSILDCRELGLRVSRLSTVYERLTARLPVEYASHDLEMVLGRADSAGERLYLAAKRGLDVVVALAGLTLVALLTPWVALINALTSPGPLFYRQQRIGQGGRPFQMLKFRSMDPDAERDNGAVWADHDDPRITPLGCWLRRAHLDELPQFWNVLRGQMSVVGPRPERPQFVGLLSRTIPMYRARHAVKPGITGWTQIHYRYGNSEEDARHKLEYDLYYVKHAGLGLDLQIMLQTIPVMLKFKGL